MNIPLLVIAAVLLICGRIAWEVAATKACAWLVREDATFKPPNMLARMMLGRLFNSFGTMARFAHVRRTSKLDTQLSIVYWAGIGTMASGVCLGLGALTGL